MATVAELNAKAHNLSKMKAKTLVYTLGHMDSEAILNTLAHTVAEVEVKKRADSLCYVKALAQVDVLAYMLAWKKEKTNAATPGEMWKLRHWSRRWLTR